MKIATLFPQGAYGTTISWCVYSFSELNQSDTIMSPIEAGYSSHGYRNSEGIKIVTPMHVPDPSYVNYILVDFSEDRVINYFDNQFQKQALGNLKSYLDSVFPDVGSKLNEAWGGSDYWQLRDLLSFLLKDMLHNIKKSMDDYYSQVQNNNCYKIDPEQFLLNIVPELENLLDHFNLKKHKQFAAVEQYINAYLDQQVNFTKNCQIDNFVDAIINCTSYAVSNLTIFDEAYIQYKLRLQQREIKCYNLNVFPNNSMEIVKLLV